MWHKWEELALPAHPIRIQVLRVFVSVMAMPIYFPMRIDAYVRYIRHMSDICAILSDNAEVDADIRIRMAIPSLCILDIPQPMGLVLQRLGLHRGMFPPKEPNCSKYKVDMFDMAFHLQKFTQIMATVSGQSSIFQPYLRLRLKLWRLWWWTNGVT